MSQCLSLFKIDSNSDGMDTFPSPSVSLNFSTKPTSVDRPVQKIKNRYQCHRKSLMHKIISLNWLSELRDLTVYSEQMGSVGYYSTKSHWFVIPACFEKSLKMLNWTEISCLTLSFDSLSILLLLVSWFYFLECHQECFWHNFVFVELGIFQFSC